MFVVDLYVRRQALGLGDDAYHPIGLPPSHVPSSPPGTAIDAKAHPSFDEAIKVWDERLAEVRSLLEGLSPEEADTTRPVDAPGFPPMTETIPGASLSVLTDFCRNDRILSMHQPRRNPDDADRAPGHL